MPLTIPLTLTDSDLDALASLLADRIAVRLAVKTSVSMRQPVAGDFPQKLLYSEKETAAMLSASPITLKQWRL